MDGRFSDKDIEKIFVPAARVHVGDTLYFGDERYDVQVERVSVSGYDGAIGLHAKAGAWSSWYAPGNSVCIYANLERASIESAAKREEEAARVRADLRINEMKNDGSLERMALERALAEQVRWEQS